MKDLIRRFPVRHVPPIADVHGGSVTGLPGDPMRVLDGTAFVTTTVQHEAGSYDPRQLGMEASIGKGQASQRSIHALSTHGASSP